MVAVDGRAVTVFDDIFVAFDAHHERCHCSQFTVVVKNDRITTDAALFRFQWTEHGSKDGAVQDHSGLKMSSKSLRLETKSCRILLLTYVTKYDMT